MCWSDYLRLFNILLICAYFVYMVTVIDWWATRPREERMVLVSHPILLGITAYASLEGITSDLSPGVRVFLYTPSLILCLVALVALSKKIRYVRQRKDDQ